jgi:hypothetical protein
MVKAPAAAPTDSPDTFTDTVKTAAPAGGAYVGSGDAGGSAVTDGDADAAAVADRLADAPRVCVTVADLLRSVAVAVASGERVRVVDCDEPRDAVLELDREPLAPLERLAVADGDAGAAAVALAVAAAVPDGDAPTVSEPVGVRDDDGSDDALAVAAAV